MSTFLASVWDWLLKTTWQASILALIVLIVQWALREKLSARWRYALWLVVLIRLVLPCAPQSGWSIFNYVRVESWARKAAGPVNPMEPRKATGLPVAADS